MTTTMSGTNGKHFALRKILVNYTAEFRSIDFYRFFEAVDNEEEVQLNEQMHNTTEVIENIHSHGIKNACDETYIVPDDFPVGQYLPQGDINILRMPCLPEGAVPIAKTAQLAPGMSRGSRHCIKAEDLKHCDFYGFLDANPLEGPIVVFNDTTIIEHPEHRDYVWPAGVYAIGYQLRHGDEVRRIKD